MEIFKMRSCCPEALMQDVERKTPPVICHFALSLEITRANALHALQLPGIPPVLVACRPRVAAVIHDFQVSEPDNHGETMPEFAPGKWPVSQIAAWSM